MQRWSTSLLIMDMQLKNWWDKISYVLEPLKLKELAINYCKYVEH